MDVELVALLISVVASVVAFLSAKMIKMLNTKLDKTIYLKNSSGEVKEISIGAGDTERNIQEYLDSALEYENEVGNILKRYHSKLIRNHITELNDHKYQVDFLLKNYDKSYFFEVKSHKRPLNASIVAKIIEQLPYNSDGNVIVSKNGFTESALELIKKANKKIMPVSGVNREELTLKLDEFAASKGITSQTNGTS
ncbi:hypothetical protein [Aeromonas rivipollensis]|uniref:hypothetical protein n=1 Tax=Aeromonas rivipollensis TaxID=948519 RepID=UPI0027D9AD21|nr:hypothetical protein [uncultured Aeromonas sp.]MDU1141748.1 hypothetical protein [Aeromonas hydrophila]